MINTKKQDETLAIALNEKPN